MICSSPGCMARRSAPRWGTRSASRRCCSGCWGSCSCSTRCPAWQSRWACVWLPPSPDAALCFGAAGLVHLEGLTRSSELLGSSQLSDKLLTPSCLLLQGPVEVVKKGTVKKVFVQLEDRQGGRKHLTRVTHVESFGFDPDALGGEGC